MPETIDVTIIGAGIVGLAIAAELSGNGREVYLLEKNRRFGQEQSSRTSEVIPIINGRMTLGTWQGIFLFEHRRSQHQRQIAVSVVGE